MPPKGGKQSSLSKVPASRRVLRAHSRLSAAHDIHMFFAESPIPTFRHQVLEAYVRAIAQEYESEIEPGHENDSDLERKRSAARPRKKTHVSTNSASDSASDSLIPLSKHLSNEDMDGSPVTLQHLTRKVYLRSGLFCEVQHRKKNTQKPFVFSLPVKTSTLLTDQQDFALPFAIYNSLPAGNPHWKNLKKNVWVDVDVPSFHGPRALCSCTKTCDEDCLNRMLQYECDEETCPFGKNDCGNRAFQVLTKELQRGKRYSNGFEVAWLGLRGYGLKTTRPYAPGELIIEYCGDVISPTEMKRRMKEHYLDSKNHYFLSLENGCVIDSGLKGSAARFANHSCSPNSEMQKWYVNGIPRIGLFASESIPPNTELTYDYNFDWFEGAKMQVCLCGEPNCRGYIGKRTSRRPTPDDQPDETIKKRTNRRKNTTTDSAWKTPVLRAEESTEKEPTKISRPSSKTSSLTESKKSSKETTPKSDVDDSDSSFADADGEDENPEEEEFETIAPKRTRSRAKYHRRIIEDSPVAPVERVTRSKRKLIDLTDANDATKSDTSPPPPPPPKRTRASGSKSSPLTSIDDKKENISAAAKPEEPKVVSGAALSKHITLTYTSIDSRKTKSQAAESSATSNQPKDSATGTKTIRRVSVADLTNNSPESPDQEAKPLQESKALLQGPEASQPVSNVDKPAPQTTFSASSSPLELPQEPKDSVVVESNQLLVTYSEPLNSNRKLSSGSSRSSLADLMNPVEEEDKSRSMERSESSSASSFDFSKSSVSLATTYSSSSVTSGSNRRSSVSSILNHTSTVDQSHSLSRTPSYDHQRLSQNLSNQMTTVVTHVPANSSPRSSWSSSGSPAFADPNVQDVPKNLPQLQSSPHYQGGGDPRNRMPDSWRYDQNMENTYSHQQRPADISKKQSDFQLPVPQLISDMQRTKSTNPILYHGQQALRPPPPPSTFSSSASYIPQQQQKQHDSSTHGLPISGAKPLDRSYSYQPHHPPFNSPQKSIDGYNRIGSPELKSPIQHSNPLPTPPGLTPSNRAPYLPPSGLVNPGPYNRIQQYPEINGVNNHPQVSTSPNHTSQAHLMRQTQLPQLPQIIHPPPPPLPRNPSDPHPMDKPMPPGHGSSAYLSNHMAYRPMGPDSNPKESQMEFVPPNPQVNVRQIPEPILPSEILNSSKERLSISSLTSSNQSEDLAAIPVSKPDNGHSQPASINQSHLLNTENPESTQNKVNRTPRRGRPSLNKPIQPASGFAGIKPKRGRPKTNPTVVAAAAAAASASKTSAKVVAASAAKQRNSDFRMVVSGPQNFQPSSAVDLASRNVINQVSAEQKSSQQPATTVSYESSIHEKPTFKPRESSISQLLIQPGTSAEKTFVHSVSSPTIVPSEENERGFDQSRLGSQQRQPPLQHAKSVDSQQHFQPPRLNPYGPQHKQPQQQHYNPPFTHVSVPPVAVPAPQVQLPTPQYLNPPPPPPPSYLEVPPTNSKNILSIQSLTNPDTNEEKLLTRLPSPGVSEKENLVTSHSFSQTTDRTKAKTKAKGKGKSVRKSITPENLSPTSLAKATTSSEDDEALENSNSGSNSSSSNNSRRSSGDVKNNESSTSCSSSQSNESTTSGESAPKKRGRPKLSTGGGKARRGRPPNSGPVQRLTLAPLALRTPVPLQAAPALLARIGTKTSPKPIESAALLSNKRPIAPAPPSDPLKTRSLGTKAKSLESSSQTAGPSGLSSSSNGDSPGMKRPGSIVASTPSKKSTGKSKTRPILPSASVVQPIAPMPASMTNPQAPVSVASGSARALSNLVSTSASFSSNNPLPAPRRRGRPRTKPFVPPPRGQLTTIAPNPQTPMNPNSRPQPNLLWNRQLRKSDDSIPRTSNVGLNNISSNLLPTAAAAAAAAASTTPPGSTGSGTSENSGLRAQSTSQVNEQPPK